MAKFDVMTVTPAASGRVAEILARSPDAVGIRLGVKNGGCAGMEYTVELANEARPGEDRVETPGGTVFVSPAAVLFLLGTELDYEVTKLRTGFVFKNPNQKSACGCGESVELTPAQMTPEMLQARSGPSA
ncbi:MAG: iron-sulfur cluster assembly accessory protein [Nitratireductor sp.]|jgi:iron-sulfur cluster assembly protein|nr:iron-sulfur cluster assembly accessory protein [Nitratireductor sp.]